ncbi:hypothetical protein AAKU55_003070 [Oxalobacteraceae bacterium GrIS 1.11]
MNDDAKPQGAVIELSTVHFYKGQLGPTVALKDMGLTLSADIPGTLSALYGYQSKQDGFMAAGQYADRHGLQFTVIDFLVKLDHKPNPGLMKPEELMRHDFFTFQRSSRAMLDEVDAMLMEKFAGQGVPLGGKYAGKPHLLVIERPELIATLLSDAAMAHVKVVVHGARTCFSDRPLNVGTVPFDQWDAIQEATCRLNPGTTVTLERPTLLEHVVRVDDVAPPVSRANQPRPPARVRTRSI